MAITLRVEDRLDGVLNFNSWKVRIINMLEESDLGSYMTRVVEEPTNDDDKATLKKDQSKSNRIIYDYVKDHLIPIISPLKIVKDCYNALVKLFETNTPNQKRALKGKLCSIKMMKDDTITTFFMKISHLKDYLVATGENVEDDVLV